MRYVAYPSVALLAAFLVAGLITAPASAETSPSAAPESEPGLQGSRQQRAPQARREMPRRPRSPDREAMKRQQQEFVELVALRLGIEPERLNAAITEARIEFVNKAVASGKMSREQADRIIRRTTGGPEAAGPAGRGSDEAAEAVKDISVTFKLDPRLTKSLYMGDVWVAPNTYSSVRDEMVVVDARATLVGAGGQALRIDPVWTAEPADMVTVTPGQARQVTITVTRAGESVLRVASDGMVKELPIKAWYEGKALHVDIDTTRSAAIKVTQMSPGESARLFARHDDAARGEGSQP
jgi:hypothetical protein